MRKRPGSSEAFRSLAVAHVLNAAADAMVAIALANSVFFSVSISSARNRIALSLLLTMLPFAIVAPFVGPFIDRNVNQRRVLLLISLASRCLIALMIANYLSSWLFFPWAFGSLVFSRAYGVIKSALVPHVVEDESRLVEANSKLTLIGVLGGALGGGIAAGLLKVSGSSYAVLFLSSVVFAAGTVAARQLDHVRLPEHLSKMTRQSIPASIAIAATVMSGLRGLVGFFTFAVAFALRREKYGAMDFGFVLASSLGGAFIGALIAPRLRKVIREERMLELGLLLVFVASLVATQLNSIVAACVVSATTAMASNFGRMGFDSMIQRDAPAARQGRMFGLIEAGLQVSWVVGALIPVMVVFPLQSTSYVMAIISIAIAVLYAVGGYPAVWRKWRARKSVSQKSDTEKSDNEKLIAGKSDKAVR